MDAVIEVEGLTMRYGARPAVDRVGFEVQAGEIFGFLGPTAPARPPRSGC